MLYCFQINSRRKKWEFLISLKNSRIFDSSLVLFYNEKIFSASVVFLAAVTLAACSNNHSSVTSKSSESKAASSSVKKSSKSSSKASNSSSSSTSSSANLETPDFVLVTDEEIANATTIGDLKTVYNKLADNYIKYSGEIREKLPESERADFDKEAEEGLKAFEESKQTLSDQLSQYGSDDLEVPAEVRDPFLQNLKEKRDKLVNVLKMSYIFVSNMPKKQ